MAQMPRLSSAAEHRLLKTACGLPPGLQRLVFGKPASRDGQTVAPDVWAFLKIVAMAGETSYTGGLGPLQAREQNRIGAEAVKGPRPLPMARVESRQIPGQDGTTIPARFYLPHGLPPAQPAPLLIYFHGGGWVIGDLDTHDGVCRFLAANAGVAVLAVDYRLSPEHPFPAPVEDAWSAFAWAAANAGELAIDPERIAVGGDSAGGNLAAVVSLLALAGGGAMPAMQLLIYPPTDSAGDFPSRLLFADGFMLTKGDMDNFEGHYLPPGVDKTDPRVSILLAPDLEGLPPAYLTTAGFDPLRDEGEAYGLRMREAGVRVAIRRHQGLIHGFANMTAISRSSRAAMLEVAGALQLGLAPR
jgi:acetyl esterase/lipase